ncbi:protein JINGUBANG-like [Cynara cardunculus var. scolymus]|uniref:protein JINGUBANG-like n=1 Tax=Cynara cardunculus var. scolymus TaxID=59895 RepID=UPI000D6259AC|nr:protein JINGUBANG-like [Cynara cardunculus var. scolymus]
MNCVSCSCSFRWFSDDHQSNFRSQSFSQDSFNSSFSSRSSIPPSISALIPPPSTTVHHHCVSTFQPNSSHILSLTLAGNLLFSGSFNAQIHLWPRHPTTVVGDQFITIPCTSAVKSLQILNDNTLITAHQDHKIRIWKIDELKIITTLPTLKDRLTKIPFAKNYVQIRRHKKLTWIHHIDAVSSLAVSIDRSLIYSASWDRSFKVWRSSDFKCLESISNAHDDAINAVVVSGDGFVYTGSADKKIKVWRNNRRDKKHELVDSLEHHKSAVNALDYDNNGSVLYSGACSGVLIASERNSGGGDGGHMVVVGGLLGHKKAILCVRVVSELVCSGSADKTVRLWRRSVGKSYSCLGVFEGHGGPVKCLAMAAESSGDHDDDDDEGSGYTVYSGSLDGDIKVWKVWVPFAMEKASMHI